MSHMEKGNPRVWDVRLLAIIALAVLVLWMPDVAQAVTTTDELPFNTNAMKLQNAITGPVPTIISIVGIVGCGGMLIFGGEITGFARALVFLVLVISVLVQAGNIVEILGGNPITVPSSGNP